MSSLETPRFLKMIAATTPTVTFGRPIARYSDGTQLMGWRLCVASAGSAGEIDSVVMALDIADRTAAAQPRLRGWQPPPAASGRRGDSYFTAWLVSTCSAAET
jgi:hypothetical protein